MLDSWLFNHYYSRGGVSNFSHSFHLNVYPIDEDSGWGVKRQINPRAPDVRETLRVLASTSAIEFIWMTKPSLSRSQDLGFVPLLDAETFLDLIFYDVESLGCENVGCGFQPVS